MTRRNGSRRAGSCSHTAVSPLSSTVGSAVDQLWTGCGYDSRDTRRTTSRQVDMLAHAAPDWTRHRLSACLHHIEHTRFHFLHAVRCNIYPTDVRISPFVVEGVWRRANSNRRAPISRAMRPSGDAESSTDRRQTRGLHYSTYMTTTPIPTTRLSRRAAYRDFAAREIG